MGLRRWGAVAAAALLVAGCGSSIGGQASPATSTGSTGSSASTTGISVAPFPDPPTSAPSTTSTTSTTATTGTTTSTPVPATTAPTTTVPSTTVKWSVPLPTGGAGKVNKFGNVVGAPGRSFAVEWRSTKQIAVVFVVDSVQVDRGCEVKVKPKNGHLLVISMRAQLGYSTGEELRNESIGFTDQFWTAFDAKDTAQVDVDTDAASSCLTGKTRMPFADDMEPGTVHAGKIALDVSSATGTVVLMDSLDGGWVYTYR